MDSGWWMVDRGRRKMDSSQQAAASGQLDREKSEVVGE